MDKLILFLTKKKVYGLFLIIAIAIIVYIIFDKFLNRILLKNKSNFEKKRALTVLSLFKNFVKYVIIFFAVIFILDLYGVNVTGLVASLGVASAVAALALQDTLKDIISGTTIIMDNYYVVGDFITYNNFTGKVISLGIRSTKIQDFDGKTYTIANRNINEIVNLSQSTASSLIVIPVAYEEKIEKVEKVLDEVIKEVLTWPTVKNETSYKGVYSFNTSSIDYSIRLYCSPGNLWQYKRDILRLVKIKFDKYNIEIPYTKIEVQNGKGKK